MKRTPIAELLDSDAGTPEEIRGSMRDLRIINRYFGGVGTARALVERISSRTGESRLSLLEIASGSGYVPEAVSQRVKAHGVELDVTLLDRARSHLGNGSQAVIGDALALPFREASFDIVSSTLFAHHLAPEELVQYVQESLRVCRTAVLINELIRNRLHLMMVYAGLPLFRSRITWHDAPASVIQAYTVGEMREMLKQIPAKRVEISRHYLFRMGVIVWKD